MKMERSYFLLSLIALSIVGHVSAFDYPEEKPQICVPDREVSYDHNLCRCNKEGTELLCERTMYSSVVSTVYESQLQNISYPCVPNTRFQSRCKDCMCQENGKYASCINECHYSPYYNSPLADETPDRCMPGSAFLHECNQCICGPNGKAACTNLDCNKLDDSKYDGIQCVPRTSLLWDCKQCGCDDEGKINSCLRMGCDVKEFKHKHILNVTMDCAPEKIFEYNCHHCYCDRSGEYAMCSGKACPDLETIREVKDTQEKCNPGMIFSKDCNVCVCGQNGKGVCTTIACDYKYSFKYVPFYL